MNAKRLILLGVAVPLLSGCALREVRSKSKVGPEYRHKGSSRTDAVRWTGQEGIELKWDKGISTGLTYRRRDTDNGGGNNDNGVWFDVSFPLWKAKRKTDVLAQRVATLERQLAELRNAAQTGAQ